MSGLPPLPAVPRCPVTGEPAIRLVQRLDARLLTAPWRILFRADPRPSFRGTQRFGLWQSPTGMYFFDPMLAGDAEFYARFHANRGMQGYICATRIAANSCWRR